MMESYAYELIKKEGYEEGVRMPFERFKTRMRSNFCSRNRFALIPSTTSTRRCQAFVMRHQKIPEAPRLNTRPQSLSLGQIRRNAGEKRLKSHF